VNTYTVTASTPAPAPAPAPTPTPTQAPAPAPVDSAISWPQVFLTNQIERIPTPYGVSQTGPSAQYTGNRKKTRANPIEANVTLQNFRSGLNLQVVDGGVRMPADSDPK